MPTFDATETPTLTKSDLAELLRDHVGLTQREAKAMAEAFFEIILDALESGECVRLAGFGSFHLHDKRSRPGRNLRTGIAMLIAARRVVTFRSSPTLKTRIK